jgi:plastocyanin
MRLKDISINNLRRRKGWHPLEAKGLIFRLKQVFTVKPHILPILAMILLVNCGPRSGLGPALLIYPEMRPIKIELRSFSFEPNHFVILQNHSPFTLRLTNTADTLHNFTLLDPRRSVILEKDLIANESITFAVGPLSSGNYLFYCNRFLHRHKGMKGMLMVE